MVGRKPRFSEEEKLSMLARMNNGENVSRLAELDAHNPGGLTFMVFPAGVLAGMSAAWTAVATHSARTGRMISSAG
ncbi:hypothetical protein SO078_31020 (plasmid) [Sinorhizobium meliloti]|uniref:hypothetical protein n=1 Tax=Rhizobium meliloti TaxID=382 RepID=UPI002D79DBFB|nr:hypothetical protein [Sinorhizobium meliloti]WRQ71932.1 hypothetical protein SO078_31020 [Sinorhizobium meliloti]